MNEKKVGKAVLDRLGPFTPGSSAERLIEKPSFYEINSAKGITVYCECEFHDTKEGSEFIIKNTKKLQNDFEKDNFIEFIIRYGKNTSDSQAWLPPERSCRRSNFKI